MGNIAIDAIRVESAPRLGERAAAATRENVVAWYLWCLAAAVTCDAFGGYWDISWHISIGRDSFWTPAHMMVYLAGILAGVAAGYTILATTFGSSAEAKDRSVGVWGFRGPLGCFIAAWGGVAMLTSAPFDNWWHSAYGLDVKIVSLPHSILAFGEGMITLGAVLLVSAHLNCASGEYRAKLDRLLLYIGGIAIFGSALFRLESTPMEFMHSSEFYRAMCSAFPLILIAIACVSESRWPATTMAAIYTALFLAALWIFPLFPAEPKLGPVYQHITHMVPLWFPVLLIAPAFALDLLRAWLGARWIQWRTAIIAGSVFLGMFLIAQWPFADFLISPAARNAIFGTIYFPYSDPANLLYNPYGFAHLDKSSAALATGMLFALADAILFSSIGIALGRWMRKLQR